MLDLGISINNILKHHCLDLLILLKYLLQDEVMKKFTCQNALPAYWLLLIACVHNDVRLSPFFIRMGGGDNLNFLCILFVLKYDFFALPGHVHVMLR